MTEEDKQVILQWMRAVVHVINEMVPDMGSVSIFGTEDVVSVSITKKREPDNDDMEYLMDMTMWEEEAKDA
jgi:hypothetical protein